MFRQTKLCLPQPTVNKRSSRTGTVDGRDGTSSDREGNQQLINSDDTLSTKCTSSSANNELQNTRKTTTTTTTTIDNRCSFLNLPKVGSRDASTVDLYLSSIPECISSRDRLLVNSQIVLDKDCTQRIIYAGQREIAHVHSNQCDIIVSDRATTCHIIIFRSNTICNNNNNNNTPIFNTDRFVHCDYDRDNDDSLCTVAHLDNDCYDTCIRKAFYYHQQYHLNKIPENNIINNSKNNEDGSNSQSQTPTIAIDIHIVGGFEDNDGSSRKISNWLLYLLADISSELAPKNVIMTLQTIAITSMNNNTNSNTSINDGKNVTNNANVNRTIMNTFSTNSPIGRGLAMECKTGNVFLARCTHDIMGPAMILRHARLWYNEPTLLEIYKSYSTEGLDRDHRFIIEPFFYYPYPYLKQLIQIKDDTDLLKVASTSPECEEDDFCYVVRQTIQFVMKIPYEHVFCDCNDDDNNHNHVPVDSRGRNGSTSAGAGYEKRCLLFERCPVSSSINVNRWIQITKSKYIFEQ